MSAVVAVIVASEHARPRRAVAEKEITVVEAAAFEMEIAGKKMCFDASERATRAKNQNIM
jgi:hypothetical protein